MILSTALGLFGPSSFRSAKTSSNFFALRRGITSHHGTGNLSFGDYPHAVAAGTMKNMHVIADVCIIPLGVGVSVSAEIALCERILTEAGLSTRLHAYGTNVEGEWDQVFAAVKRCHEALHIQGVPRISTNMRFGTRIDRGQNIEDKIRSVEEKLKPPA
jgi:uncharacterized protein (TIGR00106 family)